MVNFSNMNGEDGGLVLLSLPPTELSHKLKASIGLSVKRFIYVLDFSPRD
jgi:hypothetical protein